MSMYRSEEQDRKEYEQIKEIAKKQMGTNADKWIERMENFKNVILRHNREIKKKYESKRIMSINEIKSNTLKRKEIIKQRIEILKQYPYYERYEDELKRYLTDNHGYIDFCEMIISDEFNIFKFNNKQQQPIVVISGWWKNSRNSDYHHIRALCILPKNHKLTLNEFIEIESKTKAPEVKVINENEIITYTKIGPEYIKNINVIGKRSGYSLYISRI